MTSQSLSSFSASVTGRALTSISMPLSYAAFSIFNTSILVDIPALHTNKIFFISLSPSFIFIIYSLNSIELFNIKLETNLSIFVYHSSTFMKKIYQKSEVFTSLFFPRHPLYYDLHLLDDAHHLQ